MAMRLTLRALLNWINDMLLPNDAEQIAREVKESKVATTLLNNINEVMQFPQLPAPMVLDGTPLGNANTAAEYLDNVLDAQTTPEFEKFCIGSAIVLGEVAACHKILAQVLTEEPTSEAPLELKEKIKRLYGEYYAEEGFVPQNAETDLAILGSGDVPLHNIADGSLHQNIEAQSRLTEDEASSDEAPAEEAEDEDEYEYVPSRAPWVLCTVVLAILCLVLLLRGNGKKEVAPAPAGETPVAATGEQAGTAEESAEAGKTEETDQNAEADKTADAVASEETKPAETEGAENADEAKAETPEKPADEAASAPEATGDAEKPAETPATEETEAAPEEAKPVEPAPAEPAPATEEKAEETPEAPAVSETEKPAETEAKEEAKAEPEAETDTPAMEEDANEPGEASPWASDSNAGKQVATGQLLIRQNKTSKPNAKDAWVLVGMKDEISVGESYVSLPGFQPKIDFAKQIQATLKDSAKLEVKEGADGRIELLMDYGQFVFQTAERGAKSVQLAIAGFEGVKLFLAPETLVAFDVRLDDHSSADPAISPVVLVDVYLFDGGMEVSGKKTLKNYEAGGGVAFQMDPGVGNGVLPPAKPMTLVPTWIVKNGSARRKDSMKMREMLVKNYEAGKSLLTCLYEFESDKNKNIQALATQSLLQLGDKNAIDDFVKLVLKNPRKKQDRQMLRKVIFQSQQHAQVIKKQMSESKNEDLYKSLLKK